MPQSNTLSVGMDVDKESSAVASVANADGAVVVSLGPIGTRPCALDALIRQLHSKSQPLGLSSEAGPWGAWLSRDLTHKGHDGWVVAPSLIPKQAGDRVQTDRRDAVPWARLLRSGDLTPVSVPRSAEAAMRDLKTAQCRLTAFLLRQARRATGQAMGVRPPSDGARRAAVRRLRSRSCSRSLCGPSPNSRPASSGWSRTCTSRSQPGVWPRWSRPSRG
jgi:transposase